MTNPADYLSFWEFFSEAFVPLNGISLELRPQHRTICETLEQAVLNELTGPDGNPAQFVIINQPPRTGKTKIIEALGCWMAHYFPNFQAIYTSYSSKMAELSLSYMAKTMQEQWYKETFGDYVHSHRSDHLNTIGGANIYAIGAGGSITGKGAGLKHIAGGFISCDDPAKPEETFSAVETDNVKRWFESTLKSRRNSDKYCPIIVMAQRIGPEDLVGYLLKEYPHTTIVLKVPGYKDGKSLFPDTYSEINLEAEAKSPDRKRRFVFASQIQQEPVAYGGNKIPVDSFRRYKLADAYSMKWERLLMVADTAFKKEQWNDRSVLGLWGKRDHKAYLIDLAAGRWESPQLLANMRLFWKKHTNRPEWGFPQFHVEDKASGISAIQTLRGEGIPIIAVERDKDKVTRCEEILPFIDTGMVYIPNDGELPLLGEFLTECAQFKEDGTATHDDYCLISRTEITTHRGQVPIEQVTSDDYALTRFGWRRVIAAKQTGTAASLIELRTMDSSITGTANHPVYVKGKGFIRLDAIIDGDIVVTCQNEHQNQSIPLHLTESYFAGIQKQNSYLIDDTTAQAQFTGEPESVHCIKKYGRRSMDQYHRDTISTTETETQSTTKSRIWSASRTRHTFKSTQDAEISAQQRRSTILSKLDRLPLHGTDQRKAGHGTGITVKHANELQRNRPALSAADNSWPPKQPPFVQNYVEEETEGKLNAPWSNAMGAACLSQSQPIAFKEARVISVRRFATDPVSVFNLTVAGDHEYFANGILTHNCDTLFDAVKILLGKPPSILEVLGKKK